MTKIILTEQLLTALLSGKRIAGTIRMVRVVNDEITLGFSPRQQRAKHKPDQTLLQLPHGRLDKSPKRYKLSLSIPDKIGERDAADLMSIEAQKGSEFIKALDQILNHVV